MNLFRTAWYMIVPGTAIVPLSTDLFLWFIQVPVERPFSMHLNKRKDLVSLYFGGFTGLIDLNLIVIPGFATAQSAFLSLKGPCWTIHPKIHPYRQFSVPWSHPWVSRTLTMPSLHLAWQLVSFIIILAVFLWVDTAPGVYYIICCLAYFIMLSSLWFN